MWVGSVWDTLQRGARGVLVEVLALAVLLAVGLVVAMLVAWVF